MKNIENWFVPPIEGMEVRINPESPNAEQYLAQSGEETGIITGVDITEDERLEWIPKQHMEDYSITVRWTNQTENEYSLIDLIPTGNYKKGIKTLYLTRDYRLDLVGDYKERLIKLLVSYGLKVIECKTRNGVDFSKLLEYITHTSISIENRLINGATDEYLTNMYNALLDAKERVKELERNQEQNQENAAT